MISNFIYSLLSKFIKNRRILSVVYKAVCIVLSSVIFGIILYFTLISNIKYYGIAIMSAIVYIIIIYAIATQKSKNFHPFPSCISNLDAKGGRIEIITPTREKVMRIEFDNGCEIELNYDDGTYTATLKNDEWDTVQSEDTADSGDELGNILKNLIDNAVSYTPADAYSYEADVSEEENVIADSDLEDKSTENEDTTDINDESDDENRIYTRPGDDGAVL